MEHIDHNYISKKVIKFHLKVKLMLSEEQLSIVVMGCATVTVDTPIASICKESAGSHFQNLIWILTSANAGYMLAVGPLHH